VAIPIPSVALVGYTNAGKSTLFRSLTGENAYVADQLFATLDPTVRRLQLPGGTTVVAADTVGFIRDLPHELVAAFQSTLTEAREANLLLHVIDASDPRRAEHMEEVDRVLSQIGAGEIPSIRVFNKIDRLEVEPHLDRDESGTVQSVWISAARGQGLDLLGRAVAERLSRAVHRMRVQLPLSEGAARARLYAAGVVLDEQPSAEAFDLTVDLPDSELEAIGRMPGAKLVPVSGDTLKSAGKTHRRQSGWR
jgi:GTP-binding protein HflX